MTHFTLMQVKLYVGAVSRATLPVSAPAAAEGPAEAAADATSKGGRKKSGSFLVWCSSTTFGLKTTTYCFCFHSMQKPPKRVKTQ